VEGSLNVIIRSALNVELANLTITIDMGEMSSRGTYRPAPS
jgi:hypothetical protein